MENFNPSEQESHSPFETFLKERQISSVIFDIDNTLLETDEYYHQAHRMIAISLREQGLIEGTDDEVISRFQIMLERAFLESNYQPILITEECTRALGMLLEKEVEEEIKVKISETLQHFYTDSPIPFNSTISVLEVLKNLEIHFAMHSHAQEEWTRIKVEKLKKDINIQKIQYLATDITKKKDKESWEKAFNMMSCDINNILVVGDSFSSDILPAIQAGCKNLIWIDRYEKGFPTDFVLPDDVEISIVKSLEEVLRLGL